MCCGRAESPAASIVIHPMRPGPSRPGPFFCSEIPRPPIPPLPIIRANPDARRPTRWMNFWIASANGSSLTSTVPACAKRPPGNPWTVQRLRGVDEKRGNAYVRRQRHPGRPPAARGVHPAPSAGGLQSLRRRLVPRLRWRERDRPLGGHTPAQELRRRGGSPGPELYHRRGLLGQMRRLNPRASSTSAACPGRRGDPSMITSAASSAPTRTAATSTISTTAPFLPSSEKLDALQPGPSLLVLGQQPVGAVGGGDVLYGQAGGIEDGDVLLA